MRVPYPVRIFYAPYSLQPLQLLNAKVRPKADLRYGALLKVEWPEGAIGYGDCCPFEALGDEPLLMQLQKLSQGILTPLTEKSMHFAKIDATQKTLDSFIALPSVSYSMQNLPCKLKVGPHNFEKVILAIKGLDKSRIRLDANGSLKAEQVWEARLELAGLDFFEDPFPFQKEYWGALQQEGVCLAADFCQGPSVGDPQVCAVRIHKPARDKGWAYSPRQRVVVTSYMDHPLGQVCAWWEAQHIYQQFSPEICGLATHTLFAPHPYASRLGEDGDFSFCQKPGWGFSELLQRENWKRLEP